MKPVMVAAILDANTLIINHGKREEMDCDTLLRIEREGKWLALLEVKRVHEKMALVSPIWAHEHCPTVGVGQELKVVDPELDLGVN